MHDYVKFVIDRVRSQESEGRGGYLRVKSDADTSRVSTYLAEERSAAQAAVEGVIGPVALINLSVPMQILILTEILLANIDEPVDIYAINMAQGHHSGYVSERVEEAADGLVMLEPRLLELIAQL